MEILNKLTKKMPASLFRAGILSLAVSAVVYILRNIIYGDFSLLSLVLYNGYFQGILLLLICGFLVEVKNVSYKIISIPFFLEIAWCIYNFVFEHRLLGTSEWIYIIFDIIILCMIFFKVNKKLIIAGFVAFGMWVCYYELGYWLYYLFNRLVLNKYSISSDETVSGILSLLSSATYNFGFFIVMKRAFEYKSEAQRKTERANRQTTAKEQLIELKIRLDAGEIDKDKYDAMRKDIIDKL